MEKEIIVKENERIDDLGLKNLKIIQFLTIIHYLVVAIYLLRIQMVLP